MISQDFNIYNYIIPILFTTSKYENIKIIKYLVKQKVNIYKIIDSAIKLAFDNNKTWIVRYLKYLKIMNKHKFKTKKGMQYS